MKRILIIDDSIEIKDLVSVILKEEGFKTIPSSPATLLKDIYRYKPGLILYDGWKRDQKEILLLKQIKEDKVAAPIPIIFFSTAHNLEELSKDCNCDYWLPKPFEIDDLIGAVKAFYRETTTDVYQMD